MTEAEQILDKIETLYKEGDFDQIITMLPDDLLEKYNNADMYAWRAFAHNRANDTTKGFEYAEKAIKADPNSTFGYRQKGNAWQTVEEYDKAIAEYDTAIKLDDKDAFSYYNRGIAWQNLGNSEKAIADYSSAIKLNPNYTNAYTNRGVVWESLNELDKASDDYDKSLEIDINHSLSYVNKGNILFKKGAYEDAIKNYLKAIELEPKFKFLDNNIKLAIERSEERKKLDTSNVNSDKIDEQAAIIGKLESIINKIRELSLSRVKTVVHYTKLSVAEIYVSVDDAKMYYSNAIYMNDPMEGNVFFDYLNSKKIRQAYLNGERRTETSVYLGSFLPASENKGEIEHEDELVMWRTYGKDESGREAAGASIILNSDFFRTKSGKAEVSSIGSSFEEQLLNVIYISNKRNNKEITNDTDGKIAPFLNELKELIVNLINIGAKSKKSDLIKTIENIVFKQLSTISYLFKSADYSFEHEVRVIKYMPRDSDDIKYRDYNEPNTPKRRFFVESRNNILPYIMKIYLGPKVENYQQWSLYFDYEIRQQAKRVDKDGNKLIFIKPNDIEILKSECKFQ